MEIIQRGNPNILKSIQKSAKKVSESNGLSNTSIVDPRSISPIPVSIPEGGAFASMQKLKQTNEVQRSSNNRMNIFENVAEKRLKERLLESVETLGATKEYFNAASSLFTLYAMGELTEGVMSSLDKEDLCEIRGIIKEFKNAIDSY